MDKGYDSETLHSFIREEIKANSVIPVKKEKEPEQLENIDSNCIKISTKKCMTEEALLKQYFQ